MVLEWRAASFPYDVPASIWEEIFVYLSNLEIASFVSCYLDLFYILKRPSFLRKYMSKFEKVLCGELINLLAERTHSKFQPLIPPSSWCMFRDFLPSGHCCACLTHPYLLLYHPLRVSCFCVNHLWFWKMDVIIWNKDCELDSCDYTWPKCACCK
ncbi:RH6 [Bovine atadenovirus D]|uniref:RH6 n=1 Tax=Bovine adenovirus 4 TaxID=70333 RepID=Q997G8_ADEB4|nr:RH6 [Bovine atadenovirus D]AAK13187.2 RH6 [Bovine adenovirus 4]